MATMNLPAPHPTHPTQRASASGSLPTALAVLVTLALGACSQYQPIDTAALLTEQVRQRVDRERVGAVEVPFQLDRDLSEVLDAQYKTGPGELRRVEQVLDFIFRRVHLEYSLAPTRNAMDTYRAREGNCLSFVNLFVGVARHQRLNPFYVEVTDYQRWNYREGLVVSRGHIVAGMYVKGELKTYDFLPYRAKAYKDFKPIDDVTATAHFYNNLGAEALMAGEIDRGLELVTIAHQIAPDFVKALNNLGVAQARKGDLDGAMATYQEGLAIEPRDVALLTNLARAYQQLGRADEALATLAQVEGVNTTNPFFYIYKGELALAQGDLDSALEYMAEALRQDTELPEAHVALVKVYLAMGDLKRARHHLGRALRLDATNPEARRFAMMLEGAEPPGEP